VGSIQNELNDIL